MALEWLLADCDAAGALLSCMYAEEMGRLRCTTPLVRDCVDMHVAGKVLLLRPQNRVSEDFAQPRQRRQHMRRAVLGFPEQVPQIDTMFPAVTTLTFLFTSLQHGMFPSSAPRPAWMHRVTCLELQDVSGLTSEQLAALPYLRRLHVRAPTLTPLSLHACKALRELRVEDDWVELVPTVPDGQLEQVHVTIGRWFSKEWRRHASATIGAMRRVPHVILDRFVLCDKVDMSALEEARTVEFHNMPITAKWQASLASLRCCQKLVFYGSILRGSSVPLSLPPTLKHFTMHKLCFTRSLHNDVILDAVRTVPHVALKNFDLPLDWTAALSHTQTLSLMDCSYTTMPTAADWSALSSMQTLDLSVASLHASGGLSAFSELRGLPASTRLRLSAQNVNIASWLDVRDQASKLLFETYGISAVPI